MKTLLSYVPKKYHHLIKDLYREDNHICFVMEWGDGFGRSKVADNITEMKNMIEELANDRNVEF
jgi:hypothetical protein